MQHSWTHALIHHETGILAGIARDVEEIEDFGLMGTALYAGNPLETPVYDWLSRHRDLDVLALDRADSAIIAEVRQLVADTEGLA